MSFPRPPRRDERYENSKPFCIYAVIYFNPAFNLHTCPIRKEAVSRSSLLEKKRTKAPVESVEYSIGKLK